MIKELSHILTCKTYEATLDHEVIFYELIEKQNWQTVSSDIINGIFQTYGIRNLLGNEVERHNPKSHLKKTELKKFKKLL